MSATSNNYQYKATDGNVRWYKRTRYICAGRAMSRSDCKGQAMYTAKYIDSYVADYLSACLKTISETKRIDLINNKYKKALKDIQSDIRKYEEEKELHTLRLKALYSQVAYSLIGNSAYAPEVLSEVISNEKEQLSLVEKELAVLTEDINDRETLKKSLALRVEEFSAPCLMNSRIAHLPEREQLLIR